ncbi:MAG: hypothetical protein E7487_10955 [Ruminococcaceae bacterium]|nr:hypothetical protein [Oscillospiraceae bacterium]
MVAQCPACENTEWDKEISGNMIICPHCGHRWTFIKKPLFILSGCSGIGKTTTAKELQKLTSDFVVLDSDLFYNIMPHDTEVDYYAQIEQIQRLSKDIMQCGKPIVWTMAGNLDKLSLTYHSRFFSAIHVLVLVCSEDTLRLRMTAGRKITDENWIRGSLEYNTFFKTHQQIGDTKFETRNTDGKAADEIAKTVLQWLQEH